MKKILYIKLKYIKEKIFKGFFDDFWTRTILIIFGATLLFFATLNGDSLISKIKWILLITLLLNIIAIIILAKKYIKILSFKVNKKENAIHIRGIRINKKLKRKYKITNNTSIAIVDNDLKELFREEMDSVYNEVKKYPYFQITTHNFFYMQLLNNLVKDTLITYTDKEKIKKELEEGKNYIQINTLKCKVTFTLIEKNKEVMERAFVFSYCRILKATQEEMTPYQRQKCTYNS